MKSKSKKNIKASRTGGSMSVKKHPYSPLTQFSKQELN